MKKLILVMFAAMFLCNISYGATIKELLKGKESIKLVCTVEKANEWTWERHSNGDAYIKETKIDSLIGDKINYLIEVEGEESASLYVNGDKKCCDGKLEWDSVDEDKYGFSGFHADHLGWSINIYRVTGQFVSHIYIRSTNKVSVPFAKELKGDCKIAPKAIF